MTLDSSDELRLEADALGGDAASRDLRDGKPVEAVPTGVVELREVNKGRFWHGPVGFRRTYLAAVPVCNDAAAFA